MKKFFTNIPLQTRGNLATYVYKPVGNDLLGMETPTSFPIITAIRGYVKPGEDFRLIAVVADSDDGARNLAALKGEVEALCAERGILCPAGVETVPGPPDQTVASHVDTFHALIDFVDDNDELFGCITFGTKPMSQALQLALQYAYRMKKNVTISCIVYGEVDRVTSTASVYDETALLQLGEIVWMLASHGVEDPKAAIDTILSM